MGYADSLSTISELWAVINKEDGTINWSRGGSSTNPKIMVYQSESSAKRAISSPWIGLKNNPNIEIKCIYKVKDLG